MKLAASAGWVLGLTLTFASAGFSQVQAVQTVQVVPTAPTRIPQQIIVNGQQVNGAYVPSNTGGMQSFTCPSPQEYATPDGASRGWACFDAATGVWLLHALPPAPQLVQQPTVVYQAPPTTFVYPSSTIVYAEPYRTVYVRPAYRPSVVIGAAAINAAGRIASAAIIGSHHYSYRYYSYPVRGRGWRR